MGVDNNHIDTLTGNAKSLNPIYSTTAYRFYLHTLHLPLPCLKAPKPVPSGQSTTNCNL